MWCGFSGSLAEMWRLIWGGHYSTNKTLHFYLDLFLFLSNIYKVGTGTPVPVGTYIQQKLPVLRLGMINLRTKF